MWWQARAPSPAAFPGARFIGKGEYPGCTSCGVEPGRDRLQWHGRYLGGGGNSGFQAVNLAALMRPRRIVLTGFDMSLPGGGPAHWHGDHGADLGHRNPSAALLESSAQILDAAVRELAAAGIETVNASRISALKAWDRVSIEEALS